MISNQSRRVLLSSDLHSISVLMAQMETDPPDITNSCEERNRLSLEIEALDIVINRCTELVNFPDTDDNHEIKAILRASIDDTQRKKDTMCNNRIFLAQRKHLDDFLRGRIIGRLECGRTQLEISEELGISQRVICRLWQRFQEDVTANRNRQSTASDLFRQLSSATGTTDSRQTVYRRLGHIGLYARRPVRCVLLTATHCRLRLSWSREHALWTPQQWSCVMFSDESRFSLQSDSRRTLIWRAPGTRYHQENTIE
ncbi:HTH_Tnp_Tc3_2 domain-containing protein [Trichonephila clavipes]|nr:HTH_Tnp_Tc3_2 domain-containing protein [Trichonephila clavipes]